MAPTERRSRRVPRTSRFAPRRTRSGRMGPPSFPPSRSAAAALSARPGASCIAWYRVRDPSGTRTGSGLRPRNPGVGPRRPPGDAGSSRAVARARAQRTGEDAVLGASVCAMRAQPAAYPPWLPRHRGEPAGPASAKGKDRGPLERGTCGTGSASASSPPSSPVRAFAGCAAGLVTISRRSHPGAPPERPWASWPDRSGGTERGRRGTRRGASA
jgi:hypothetical protein